MIYSVYHSFQEEGIILKKQAELLALFMVAGADLLLLLTKDDVFVEHLLRSELLALCLRLGGPTLRSGTVAENRVKSRCDFLTLSFKSYR